MFKKKLQQATYSYTDLTNLLPLVIFCTLSHFCFPSGRFWNYIFSLSTRFMKYDLCCINSMSNWMFCNVQNESLTKIVPIQSGIRKWMKNIFETICLIKWSFHETEHSLNELSYHIQLQFCPLYHFDFSGYKQYIQVLQNWIEYRIEKDIIIKQRLKGQFVKKKCLVQKTIFLIYVENTL